MPDMKPWEQFKRWLSLTPPPPPICPVCGSAECRNGAQGTKSILVDGVYVGTVSGVPRHMYVQHGTLIVLTDAGVATFALPNECRHD